MPVEPVQLLCRFINRAERWRRVRSYPEMDRRGDGPVAAVSLHLPAEIPAAQGRKIAFFSDAHYRGSSRDHLKAAELVRLITAFAPDYLISGGDLTAYACDLDRQRELLNALRDTPAPVRLAIPGNWECGKRWLPIGYWRALYREYGFIWLENEWFDDGILTFYGASDVSSGHLPPLHWPHTSRQRILLAHNPDTVIALDSPRKPRAPIPLALCGHTHGGQIRLPIFGGVAAASRYGRRFDYGLFVRSGTGDRMFISSGLSQLSFPWRVGCRPEVLLITLGAGPTDSRLKKL